MVQLKLTSSAVDPTEARRSLLAILERNSLCALGTVDDSGDPHVNTAYFAFNHTLQLFILTPPHANHSRYMRERPGVALAVYESTQSWGTELRGLQLFGRAKQATGDLESEGLARYVARFHGLAEWAPDVNTLHTNLESRFYVIDIWRVKLFDEPTFGKEVWIEGDVTR